MPPEQDEIDFVFDGTGDPLSDDLIALRTLEEAAAEAQLGWSVAPQVTFTDGS